MHKQTQSHSDVQENGVEDHNAKVGETDAPLDQKLNQTNPDDKDADIPPVGDASTVLHGSYGTVFAALHEGPQRTKLVAIKFETTNNSTHIRDEALILRCLSGSTHFAKFYRYSKYQGFKFLTMEMLGPCMLDIVNRVRPYRFTLQSLLKFGIQGVEALEALHNAGYVHYDIKPGNFVIGNTKETSGIFYLIDFGLCKKIDFKTDKIRNRNGIVGLRGTLRYASLNAHHKLELGPCDDLMSLLYVLIEFYTGKLPWIDMKDIV
ncbi:MAG: hypothetical protein EZS28_039611 [Streblomastix strix]|uniref:non-specific serine/threonine protein kinase n=1 Tax=Streblomastix strix TaxID=222440 RepID=A0A5J4U4K6_9EUKA|nr:MAG: hypothetical protein EZS28_039611 [Streblomastix strix]